jgi:group I intron endonuclease
MINITSIIPIIGIYKITSPSGKIYIGQSVDINKRFNVYYQLNCKNQIKLYNSFQKYGYENHIFKIIEECTLEQLNERERYYQDYYNVTGKKGLNCKLTGTNDKCGKHSEETKFKISNSMIGRIHSNKTKQKIGKANKGRKHSEESLGKMRKPRIPRIDEHNKKLAEARCKIIIQYDLNMNFIKEWPSLISVTRELKIFPFPALTGIYKTSGGFKWEYKQY